MTAIGPATADSEEMSSEAASRALHVSRKYVYTLIEKGLLTASRTAGGHRRIPKAAVLAYKAASKVGQQKGLAAMVSASERMGLYDQELAGIPVRRAKR